MTEQTVLFNVLFMIVVSVKMIGGKSIRSKRKRKTKLIQILHRISWLDSFTSKASLFMGGGGRGEDGKK